MKNVPFISPLKIAFALLISAAFWQCADTATEEQSNENTEAVAEAMPTAVAAPQMDSPKPPVTARSEKMTAANASEIQWLSWDEAVTANESDPKMLFVDVYTDWCGWCKVMDRQTFTDPEVISYINDNYYAVKFNAEDEPTINFRGQEFKMVEGGRRGIHTLAYALLQGQLSYPSYVYLNRDFQRVNVSKGFKPADSFLAEMRAITEQHMQ